MRSRTPRNMTEILPREEIRELLEPSDFRGWLAVVTSWGIISASLAGIAWYPASPISWLLGVTLIGGRILALGILMHECAHRSLFKTRWLNDVVGMWLCAFPTWQDLRRYRPHHLRHHALAGTPEDPDIDLVTPYPASRASLIRKLLRDLSGVSGLKRILGLLLVDFGYLNYTVSNASSPVSGARSRSWSDILRCGWTNLHGLILTQAALFGLLAAVGHAWLYSAWVLAYLIPFSVFVRIRSFAEHAATALDPDPWKSSRTTIARWWERLTVAPHRVNYHLEHHLLMTVPYYKLPRLHARLRELGLLDGSPVEVGYPAVLRRMIR